MKTLIKGFFIFLVGAVMIAPSSGRAQTAADLQAQVQTVAQAAQQQPPSGQTQGGGQTWCHTFNTNLGIGSSGNEVYNLIVALSKEGVAPSSSIPDTYKTYDESYASFVSAFQEKYKDDILTPAGLVAGTGYVGGATRKKLNELYGCRWVPPPVAERLRLTISPQGTLIQGQNYNFAAKITGGAPNAQVLFYLQRPDWTMKYNGEGLPDNAVTDASGNWQGRTQQTIGTNAAVGAYAAWFTVGGRQTNKVYFNVRSGKTSGRPFIANLAPQSGVVGTRVTITGSGFVSQPVCTESFPGSGECSLVNGNVVHFGSGVIPSQYSTDGKTIAFTVPSSLDLACRFSSPRCMLPSQSLQPGTYLVYVSNANGMSNLVKFTVTSGQPATSIQVLSPNGGEVWQVGSTQTINWTYGGFTPTNVHVYILRPSIFNTTIAYPAATQTSVQYAVPSSLMPASDYRIMVCDDAIGKPSTCDTSDAPFTIAAATSTTGTQLNISGNSLGLATNRVPSAVDDLANLVISNQSSLPVTITGLNMQLSGPAAVTSQFFTLSLIDPSTLAGFGGFAPASFSAGCQSPCSAGFGFSNYVIAAGGQATIRVRVDSSSFKAGNLTLSLQSMQGQTGALTVPGGFPITLASVNYAAATPSQVQGLSAIGGISAVSLSWQSAASNAGIGAYNVYRSTVSGFTPSASNLIVQVNGPSYADVNLAAGTYYYRVAAQDVNGAIGQASTEVPATVGVPSVAGVTTPPTMDFAVNGASSGTVQVQQSIVYGAVSTPAVGIGWCKNSSSSCYKGGSVPTTCTVTAPNGNVLFSGANAASNAPFGWITDTPTSGNYTLSCTSQGGIATQSIAVNLVPPAPVGSSFQINPIAPQTVTAGQELAFKVSASGAADGTVSFSASPLPVGAGVYRLGDVSMNGSVSSIDAVYVMQYVSSTRALSAGQKLLADINQDGAVTYDDATLVSRIAVGIDKPKNIAVFDWTPTSTQAGVYTLTFTATSGGTTSSATTTINVVPPSGGNGAAAPSESDYASILESMKAILLRLQPQVNSLPQ